MEKVFVDTSAWVGFFVKKDKNHEKAVSIFEKLKQSKIPIYTSDYIIDETITTIRGRSSHSQSVIAGDSLSTSKILSRVHISPQYFQRSWEFYKKYIDKEFSFTDCTSFTVMKDLNIRKAFCFDRNFEQAGFEVLK